MSAAQQILAGVKLWMKKHPEAAEERPSRLDPGTPQWERYEAEARFEKGRVLSKARASALVVNSIVRT